MLGGRPDIIGASLLPSRLKDSCYMECRESRTTALDRDERHGYGEPNGDEDLDVLHTALEG